MTMTQTPKRGDIWLLRFPFTDLTSSKVRPALIISEHGDDFISDVESEVGVGTTFTIVLPVRPF